MWGRSGPPGRAADAAHAPGAGLPRPWPDRRGWERQGPPSREAAGPWFEPPGRGVEAAAFRGALLPPPGDAPQAPLAPGAASGAQGPGRRALRSDAPRDRVLRLRPGPCRQPPGSAPLLRRGAASPRLPRGSAVFPAPRWRVEIKVPPWAQTRGKAPRPAGFCWPLSSLGLRCSLVKQGRSEGLAKVPLRPGTRAFHCSGHLLSCFSNVVKVAELSLKLLVGRACLSRRAELSITEE
ncbi:basic proline-rich protein-like [Mustela putorius furo]|uniref:Basic proline-rich protein-like n=1 Tax=Mustela putorius furo TaxID=9669 RepID=A0A8U0RY57_MUSPF|nr:basic proline-rich protein-like [Mustela putorius furo]